MTIDTEKLRALLAALHDKNHPNAAEVDWHRVAVAAVNALPELLDALATASQVSDRAQTIADEAFGPFPVEPADTCLTYIEHGIFGLRQALATAEAERDEARAFLRRTAMTGGSIVSSAAMTAQQIAIARAADRMLVTPDGYGFVYVPGPRFCACGRIESDCDQSRASCPMTDHTSEDDESDIIIAGRQVPFVQVGMIVHPDDCLNCERDGNPLWCSALVCDIHDDDETARFGMMATLLFRNGERREEPCDELRRRWRLARDFDQNRVYTGRWGATPRGSVWPVAEVNEDA